MISPIQQIAVSCAGTKFGGCNKTAPSFPYDVKRYNIGININAEEHQKVYAREVHKKLEEKAKKAGFLKMDVEIDFQQYVGMPLEQAVLQYNMQQIYNWQHAHICIDCLKKNVANIDNIKKYISAFEAKQKRKIVKKNKSVQSNKVIV